MDTVKVVDLQENEDINVYGDLGEFDLGEEIEKLKEENRKLEKHIRSLNGNIGNLNTTLEKLKLTEGNLITNISNLYKTAVREVDRKDRLIEELRGQLDNFYINRFNPNFRNKRKNRENSPSEFNVSKKYRFDERTVSNQNYSNDIKEIQVHKQENKCGNEDPSAVRQESKCDNTHESICDKPDYIFDNEHETKQTDKRYYRPNNFNNRYSDNRCDSSSRYNRYYENENVDPRNEHTTGKYKDDEYKFKSRHSYDICSYDNEDRYGSRHQLSNNKNQYRNNERDDAYDNRNHRNNYGNSRNTFRHRSLMDRDEYSEVDRRSYYVNEKKSDRHDSEYNGQNRFSERQSHSRSNTPPVSNMKNERKEEENILTIKRRDPPEDTSALQSKPKKRLKMLDEMEKKIKQSRLSQAHNSSSDKKDSSSIYKKQSLSDICSLTSDSERNYISNNKSSKGNENLDKNNTKSKESLNTKEFKRSTKEGESPQLKSQKPKNKIEEKCSQGSFKEDTALMDAFHELKSGKNLSCNRLPESPTRKAKANKSMKKTEDTSLNINTQKYTNIKISDKRDKLIHILETGENFKNVSKQNLNSQETCFRESKSGESNNEFSNNLINSLKAFANDTSQKPFPKDSSLHTGVKNPEDYSQEFPDVEINNKKNDPLEVHILEKSKEFVATAMTNYKGIKESDNKLQISTDIGISNKKSDPCESVVHILEKSEAFKDSAKQNLDCQEMCCGDSTREGATNEFSGDEITKDRSEKPVQEESSLNKLRKKQKENPVLSDINITEKRSDPLIDSIREESTSELKNDNVNLLKASTMIETPLNKNKKKIEGKPKKLDIKLINKEYDSFNNMVNTLEASNILGEMAESKDSTKELINEYSKDKINLSKALENDISQKQISKNSSLNKDVKKIEDDPQKSTMKGEKDNSSKNLVDGLETAKELKDVPKQNSNGQEKYREESTNEESISKVAEEKIDLSSVKQKVEDNAQKSTDITISNMKDDSMEHLIHILERDKELSVVKQNLDSQITYFKGSSIKESLNEFSKDIINLSKASDSSRHILAKKIGQAIPQDPNVLEKSDSEEEFYQKNIQYPETNKDKINPQISNIEDSNLRKNVTEKSVNEVHTENTDSLKTILLKQSTVSKITDKGERNNETQNLNELETRSRSIEKGAIIENLQKNIDESKVVKKAEDELFHEYPQDLSASCEKNVERSIEMNDSTHKNKFTDLILEKSVLQESTNEVSVENINLSRNKSKHKRRTSIELSAKTITKKTKDHLLNDQPLDLSYFKMTDNNSNSYIKIPAQDVNVREESIHLSLEVADVTKKKISEESSINTVGKRTERPLLSDNCLNAIALEKTYTSTISKSIKESKKHATKPETIENKISKNCRKETLSNFEASEKFSESKKSKSVVDIESEFIQMHIETDERVSRTMVIYDTKENPVEENSETSNHSSKNSVKKPPKQSITNETDNKYYESNGKKGLVDSENDNQESNRRRSRRKSTATRDVPIELCQFDKNNKRIEEDSTERIPTLETVQKSNKVLIEMLKSDKPVDNSIKENIKHKQKLLKNSKGETEAYRSVQIAVNKYSSHEKNHIRNSKTERLKEQSDLYKTLFGQPHGIINQLKDIKSDPSKNTCRESQVKKNVNEDAHQKLKVDDKCLKRKRRKSTVVEEDIYDKNKISNSQEDYSRQNETKKSKKRSLEDYEKFKKCQREEKEAFDNVVLNENGSRNIGDLNKSSFSQKEQSHGVNRVKRRVTFCTVENKDDFNDQGMDLTSANLKDCDQLKAMSGESTIKTFPNVVESMDTEDRNSISKSNENPDTSVKCDTIEQNNKKDCKNKNKAKQRYFSSSSSGEEYSIPRVIGNVYGADSPMGVTPINNSEILEESSYDIMGHCVTVQKLIEINDVKSEKSSLIDSVQSLSDSSSSDDTIVVCKPDDTTFVEEKVDMLIKHHRENYNNSEKQMLLKNTVSTSDIEGRPSNIQINKTESKVNIISMHSLKSSINDTRNTSLGLLGKSQLDATSLSVDSDTSGNFGVVSSTTTYINSCSTSKSATDKEKGHTTARGNKSIHGIKNKRSSNIETMDTVHALTSSRLHSIVTTVPQNKTISGNVPKSVTKEKITVEDKESNDICKDQNSCHMESFVTLASSTTDPPVTPTVNLSHDGEIPVLHLEENHINNLAPEVNISDKNIITLLDSMNISNIEGDIPCKATDTTINDNNVVNSDSDRDLTFGNIFEKVSPVASTVTKVSTSTSNLQSERPPAFRRRRRCRLVIKD